MEFRLEFFRFSCAAVIQFLFLFCIKCTQGNKGIASFIIYIQDIIRGGLEDPQYTGVDPQL